MKHLKATILGGAIAAATLVSGTGLATVIDQVQFNTGAVFQSAQLYETEVGANNDILSGYGMINSINGDTGYCSNGGGFGCQLTFTFTGYKVTSITATDVVFSGGTITFYAYGGGRPFDPSNPSTASMGNVFLTTSGHTFTDPTYGNGTLVSTTSFPGNFLSSQFQGHGTGLLDVTGGDASAYFDSNTFTDNMMGFADIQFISDFSPNTCEGADAPNPYVICGSGTAKSVAVAVPEPNVLGIMGLGLAGLGLLLIRRRKGKTTA